MDTLSSSDLTLQEQINALHMKVAILEKRLEPKKRKKAWAKQPPLTLEEERQAEALIIPILANLPDGKKVNTYFISQQKLPLRRLGSVKVREYLEKFVDMDVVKKEGKGKTALYCIDRD